MLAGCDAAHADKVSSDCIFYDITVGNNSAACTVASWAHLPNAVPAAVCATANSQPVGVVRSADGTLAYSATAGYDLATGLGSVNVNNFVAAINVLGNVKDLNASAAGSTVTLTWTASPNATGYNVYQGTLSGNESDTPVLSNVQGSSAQISGLISGQRYYFKVAAITKYGVGARASETTLVVPPDAPTGLTSSTSGTSITLNWSPSASATSYAIYQGSSAGGESATPIATGLTSTSYTLKSLSPGAMLYFTVVAYNVGGASPYSAEQAQAVIPGTPTGLSALAGNGSVQLNWSAGTGDVLYNVYMGNSAGDEAATPYLKSFGGNSVVISNLYNSNTYYFTVKAVNSAGESAATSEVSATPVGSKSGSGGGGDIGELGLALLIGFGLIKHRKRLTHAFKRGLMSQLLGVCTLLLLTLLLIPTAQAETKSMITRRPPCLSSGGI